MFSLFNNKQASELKSKRQQLYRVAYAWCNDELLADDLANETIYKAIKNRNQLRDPSHINSWLFKIMANCWRDHLRKLKPEENIDELVFVEQQTPEQLLQQQEIIIQVRKAIALLPMGQRQVLTLVDIEGFSYDEVANILAIPVGTVMSRLSRARNSLREKLLQKQSTESVQNSILASPEDTGTGLKNRKLRSVK